MQTYNTDVTLDLSGQNNGAVVYAKQYDSNTRTVTVTILQDGEPFEFTDTITARMEIRKPDGEQIFNDCAISDSKVIVEIPQQALVVSGIAELEISLMENEQLITSSILKLIIEPSVLDDEKVKSSSEYLSFYNALMELQPAIEDADEAVAAANEALKKAEEAVTNSENAIETSAAAAQNAQTQAAAAETAANNATTAAENAKTQAAAADAAADRATAAAEQAEMSDAATINTRIDNLRPGAVNLFLNSADYSGDMWYNHMEATIEGTYNGTKIYKNSAPWAGYCYYIKNLIDRNLLKLGDVLTCSCYAKTNYSEGMDFYFWYPLGVGGTTKKVGKLNDEWNRFSYTITVTEGILAATELKPAHTFRFLTNLTWPSEECYVYVTNLILTKGNMIVDWSPAPEDSLSAISELNEQIDPVPGYNFLDNSNFAIWQESNIYTKADGEALARATADRWENHATESGAVTVKQGDGMTIENSGSDYVILRQILDNCSFLHGKTVTLSFSLNDTVYSHTFENIPEGFLLKYEEETWTATSDTSDNIQIYIKGNAVINWVKLELGTTPTQYIPPNYATELEKCRFYYCPLTIRRTPYCQHMDGENTVSDFQIDFGRNMRTAPTITGTVSIRYQDGNSLITDTVPETYIIQNDHAVFQYLVPLNTYITATLVLDARAF